MLVRLLFFSAACLLLGLVALRLFAASTVVGQTAGLLLPFLSTACLFYGVAESKGLDVRPSSAAQALVISSAMTSTIALDHVLLLNNANMKIGMAIAISPFFLFAGAGWWLVFWSSSNKSNKLSYRLTVALMVSLGVFLVNLFFLRLGA